MQDDLISNKTASNSRHSVVYCQLKGVLYVASEDIIKQYNTRVYQNEGNLHQYIRRYDINTLALQRI